MSNCGVESGGFKPSWRMGARWGKWRPIVRGGEKTRKTDTESARKRSVDWAVKKVWRRLCEAARSQAEIKKSVDWTVKNFPWLLVEEARH